MAGWKLGQRGWKPREVVWGLEALERRPAERVWRLGQLEWRSVVLGRGPGERGGRLVLG